MSLRGGTIIRIPDGRVGTITWRHLDGEGGVWGIRRDLFDTPEEFHDDWPTPEFMLREKAVEPLLRRGPHRPDLECVGLEYEVVEEPPRRPLRSR